MLANSNLAAHTSPYLAVAKPDETSKIYCNFENILGNKQYIYKQEY